MNSWLQTACQPYSFWYGTTRSSMKRRPRSLALRAPMISSAVSARKIGGQLGVGLRLLLHLPEGLDRVPVAVPGRVLEAAEELLVDLAVGLLHDRPQVERRGQLGEVEHPVDLPVAIVDVDRVLEQAGQLHQVELVLLVEHPLEVGEVAVHLGDEAIAPPVHELEPVGRQDGAEVRCRSWPRTRGPRGTTGLVAKLYSCASTLRPGLGRDRRRVEVAVDVLGDPVGRERRAEAPEHVVAAQPPAADVLVHRAQRVRAMQVVVDPEEAASRSPTSS